MALTMTRTRTQTALTKLVELVANIHGELEVVEGLLTEWPAHREIFAARLRVLEASRDALYATLQQFDLELNPADIGTAEAWLLDYGRRGSMKAHRRYRESLVCPIAGG